jgi:hypothetical protein
MLERKSEELDITTLRRCVKETFDPLHSLA